MGSLFYPWHFFMFGADMHICLPGYPAGQLHTPISKVLGNSCSVVARNCGALGAVGCNRAAIAAGVLPPSPPSFLSAIGFCSDPATRL